MKEIIIKRICLSDWKAKNLDVTFNDGVTKISAKNEVGKSSLQQAWNWLFTSCTTPTSGRNANLYDNRVPLSPDTPQASVKVWLTIDDTEYTLERIAQAKFKRPRGEEEWVKDTSDTYITKIDDFEVTATAFAEWVEEMICPMDMMPFVLDGAFFTTLSIQDKKKARAVIESIVGGCDIDALKGDYSKLAPKLAKHTPEQIRTQVMALMSPIKKRMDAIPAIIKNKQFVVNDLLKRYNAERLHDKVIELTECAVKSPDKETLSALISASMELGVAKYAEVEKAGIDSLAKENKELARTLAEMEGEKALIESLMEEMATIVGDKVNAILKGCQVSMFSTQVNGTRVPDCVVTDVEGVSFATLSNSARLRVNLAIQDMFREHYGITTMTWIDEAAVYDDDHLPAPTGQVCYLFAGNSDTLEVE